MDKPEKKYNNIVMSLSFFEVMILHIVKMVLLYKSVKITL